jgi:predicted kinase
VPVPSTLLLITGVPGSGKSSLARVAADELGCAVLGHDWTMAGLRAFPPVWEQMKALGGTEFRSVGWSIMWNLSRAQLREGRSVVLDGVARTAEAQSARGFAQESDARCLVVLTVIDDASLHRSRVEGRRRDIPNWPELEWESVERSGAMFDPPPNVDLVLNAGEPFDANVEALRALLRR